MSEVTCIARDASVPDAMCAGPFQSGPGDIMFDADWPRVALHNGSKQRYYRS